MNLDQALKAILHRLTPDGAPIPHNPLQRALSKVLTTVVPALYKDPLMEWTYGIWVGVFAARDEDGRQLGEANVLPEWFATPLRDSWHPFQGPGARHGHPYNVDALRQVSQSWDDLLLDAAALRDLYCLRQHREGEPLSARDLYVITAVAVATSGFLLRRGDTPARDGAVPLRASVAFKVLGGMYVAVSRMLEQGHVLLTEPSLDIDVFLDYLEAERLLLSPESRACAAPVQMIRQLAGVVLSPSDGKPTAGGLPHLGGDVERAFTYGTLCARLDLVVLLYWRCLGAYLQPLLHDPQTPAAVRERLLGEPELGIEAAVPLSAYGAVARHVLSLFKDSEPELAFLSEIPDLADAPSETLPTIDEIRANCQCLETEMRRYAVQRQPELDQVLRRPLRHLAQDAWSPAPGSAFLKGLLKMEPRLA